MVFTHIEHDRYADSLEILFAATVLNDQPGISQGYIGMAGDSFRETIREAGLEAAALENASASDLVLLAKAESEAAFEDAVQETLKAMTPVASASREKSFLTLNSAVQAHPEINMCHIAVPGEYALSEVKKALNMGLHCTVFSNNVPLSDEREMKLLAREKGLLCMGPDCGVANINGAALVLSSITNRGPFGIVGASGCGIQHVGAILHEAGSGASQIIGTGGNDLKDQVGGLMMEMGIAALEADEETKYIAIVSRKPGDAVLEKLLGWISACKKPVVALLMGCDRETVEATGAIWAENLDDCGQKCLRLIGKEYPLPSQDDLQSIAEKAAKKLAPQQKYLTALYSGGTYMDEAMRAAAPLVGPVYSNSPTKPEWTIQAGQIGHENTFMDYGEEEFTVGRAHPIIDLSVRKNALGEIAAQPETAVVLLDLILTPPGHPDPAEAMLEEIRPLQQKACAEGRELIFVASVLGTDADLQNVTLQRKKLEDAGVLVCKTNNRAAMLAGLIIRKKQEMDQQ
ncbi:MAG: FdrA family protein [Clostridia bacterium]|nr:FdrA family protein [Clostridia bacterium]